MKVEFIESPSIKQYAFTNKRVVDKEENSAELRILSSDRSYLVQISPATFQECHTEFENLLTNNDVSLDLDISYHESMVNTCSFCNETEYGYIDIPASLNIGEKEPYPSVNSHHLTTEMCRSCAKDVYNKLETILEERPDVILAHSL